MLYKDLQILYSHDKRKLSNRQSWKIRKETVLIELCSLFTDILAFELGKLCPGVGILFRFFNPGAGVLHWKAVPGVGILTKKISGPGVSPDGDGNRSNWYLHYDGQKSSGGDWKIWAMVIFGLSSIKYMFTRWIVLVTCTQSHDVREKNWIMDLYVVDCLTLAFK